MPATINAQDPQVMDGDPEAELLTEEQRFIMDLVLSEGNSVFFTGPAGTGKSFLLRKIIVFLIARHMFEPGAVAVTASTGIAASNIGGMTLHSFAGIGLGVGTMEELIGRIEGNKKKRDRWTTAKVLIIDEISMIDAQLFDKLEEIARRIRGNELPFGGIQLVITGDFFQLPPVSKNSQAKHAFQSKKWNTTIKHAVGLTQIFRQRDPVFTEMLNEMREGCLSLESIARFSKLSRPLNLKNGLEPTELFPLRAEVSTANQSRLGMLPGDEYTYICQDWGITDKKARMQLLSDQAAPQVLKLKKGAQVVLIKNKSAKLVNGSLGQVMGFMGYTTFMEYPEALHHKKWLSDGLPDLHDDPNKDLEETQYPVVRLLRSDGTACIELCIPATWTVEKLVRPTPNAKPRTVTLASRKQVPLTLAWALSIHKAQGQSLDFVRVDLGQVFEKGQAYVALSRATSMEGLQVLNFDPGRVVAHEKVKDFYETLSTSLAPKEGLGRSGWRFWISWRWLNGSRKK